MKTIFGNLKNITRSLAFLVVGVVIGLGVQYVYSWTTPPATPPAGNVSGPLTTAPVDQTKEAKLTLNALHTQDDITANGDIRAAGNVETVGEATMSANDYYIRTIGKWASSFFTEQPETPSCTLGATVGYTYGFGNMGPHSCTNLYGANYVMVAKTECWGYGGGCRYSVYCKPIVCE